MLQLLFAPFVVFIALPPIALVPAGGFLYLWRSRRRSGAVARSVPAGAALWGAYAVYESGIWLWSRDVVAPIRVDLLLIAPLLYLVSALALRSARRSR